MEPQKVAVPKVAELGSREEKLRVGDQVSRLFSCTPASQGPTALPHTSVCHLVVLEKSQCSQPKQAVRAWLSPLGELGFFDSALGRASEQGQQWGSVVQGSTVALWVPAMIF